MKLSGLLPAWSNRSGSSRSQSRRAHRGAPYSTAAAVVEALECRLLLDAGGLITFAGDHGSDAASATPYALNTSVPGEIEQPGETDWFRFDAVAGNAHAFEVVLGSLSDSVLTLYDTDGTTVLLSNDDLSATSSGSRIEWAVPSDGTYFLEVAGDAEETGDYTLTMPILVVSGNTANVYGTTGDDALNFRDVDNSVLINGQRTRIATSVENFNFHGNGGYDLMKSVGTAGGLSTPFS